MASADRGAPRLLLKLGAGGMGEVYVARAGTDLVVVKRIASPRGAASTDLDALREEFRLASRIVHPNVCRVFSVDDSPDGVAIVMEYLEGVPLWRFGSVTSDLALVAGLLVQAAAGLDAVHAHHVVHRDVNPQNLMVTLDGTVKLLDFGIAKARDTELKTRTGTVKGTPAYLSPEQVRAGAVDARADVFSLAATLYELLTGEPPFARDNFLATVLAITSDPIPDVRHTRQLPPGAAAALSRALARDPSQRFPTAGAFAAAFAAELAPLAPPALADRVRTRFALELADRRRRIDLAIEQLESGSFESPLDDELLPDAQTTVRIARLQQAATEAPAPAPAPAPKPRSRAALALLLLPAAALGAYAYRASTATTTPAVDALASGSASDSRLPVLDSRLSSPDASPAPPTPDARPPRPTTDGRRKTKTKPKVIESGPPGFLTIGSTPHATITVDGVTLGLTPLFRKPLAPGKHHIHAVCSCGKQRDLTVTIQPGTAAPAIKLSWD